MLSRVCSHARIPGIAVALAMVAVAANACTNFTEHGPQTGGAAGDDGGATSAASSAATSGGAGLTPVGGGSGADNDGASGGSASSGTGGSGGAGNNGSAGRGGGAGAGGSSGVLNAPEPSCGSKTDGAFRVAFYPENKGAVEQEIHPFFRLSNASGQPVALSRIKIRYYYTKDSSGTEVGRCFWVSGNLCTAAVFRFQDLAPPTATANRLMEVSFPAATASLEAELLEVRTGFAIAQHNLTQTNDYSFDPTSASLVTPGVFPYRDWDRVTLYVGDLLVWGKEPCPP